MSVSINKNHKNKVMNIVQEIILAIFKGIFCDFFEDTLSEREKKFVNNLKKFPYYKSLRIEKSDSGELKLTWYMNKVTLLLKIEETSFDFSWIEKRTRVSMIGQEPTFTLNNLTQDEKHHSEFRGAVEELKMIFLSFSPDAAVYFK